MTEVEPILWTDLPRILKTVLKICIIRIYEITSRSTQLLFWLLPRRDGHGGLLC
jgi:hypothetical protein